MAWWGERRDTMEKDIGLIKLWRDTLHVNLISYAVFCEIAFRHVPENNGGAIVRISSITVYTVGIDEPAYVNSKAGANALCGRVGKDSIRVGHHST